jgi:hypothetical protein
MTETKQNSLLRISTFGCLANNILRATSSSEFVFVFAILTITAFNSRLYRIELSYFVVLAKHHLHNFVILCLKYSRELFRCLRAVQKRFKGTVSRDGG